MADEEGLEYAVQHVCLNCSELGECDKGVHCEFLKIVRECYEDAVEIGRKENARLSKMLEMAINDTIRKGNQCFYCKDNYIKDVCDNCTEENRINVMKLYRAELEKRVENVK